MEYIYSMHIQKRMLEREIKKEQIDIILNHDVPSLIIPSKKDPEVDLILAKVEEKYLMIAINRLTRTLITVRPMRKEEKLFFKESL